MRAYRMRGESLGDGWSPISEMDGHDGNVEQTLRFGADNDVSVDLVNDLNGLGYSVLDAFDEDEGRTEDEDVRAWTAQHSRFLLTCDHDFLDDQATHPLEECFGVVVLAQAQTAKSLQQVLSMLTCLITGLMHYVPWEWWEGTRVKVGLHNCRLWKMEAGEEICFDLRPDHAGNLCFKRVY